MSRFKRKTRTALLGSLCVAAAVLVGPGGADALAQEPPRIREYVDLFTTKSPSTSTGRQLRIDHVNPHDPEAKPPALTHEFVELHPGTVFDTFAVPQCSASDPELLALGAAACPSDSVVGSGEIQLDTGLSDPFRIAMNDATVMNAPNQLIFFLESRDSPAPVRFVVRGKVEGNTLDVALPSPPGADGPTPTFEVLEFQNRSTVRDGRQLNFLTTPPTCPRSGYWTNRFTFTFWDGVVQTYASRSPCVGRRR